MKEKRIQKKTEKYLHSDRDGSQKLFTACCHISLHISFLCPQGAHQLQTAECVVCSSRMSVLSQYDLYSESHKSWLLLGVLVSSLLSLKTWNQGGSHLTILRLLYIKLFKPNRCTVSMAIQRRLLHHRRLATMDVRAIFSRLQSISVAPSCLVLCDPVDCSMPGFPVLQQLLELAQTHVPSSR